eukprot:1159699-Pelagomonas_calceolata.AAC.4
MSRLIDSGALASAGTCMPALATLIEALKRPAVFPFIHKQQKKGRWEELQNTCIWQSVDAMPHNLPLQVNRAHALMAYVLPVFL